MVYVNSSDLNAVEYNQGILRIRFNSGGIYDYYNVPITVYQELLNASSKGKYFHAHIKMYILLIR